MNQDLAKMADEALAKMTSASLVGMDWAAPGSDSTVFAECRYVVERRVHRWRGRKFCTNFRGLRYRRIWEWRTPPRLTAEGGENG
jgi:hypothetical protein